MRDFPNQPGNQNLSDEKFHIKLGEYMERRGRATAPTAPMETALAPPRSIGMFMPSTVPKLRGRNNLPTFLQRFRTWASISGCDSALDSEIIVRTSGTPRADLERVHDRRLVDNSLNAWQSLTKALEKEQELLKMVIRIGSISEAWRALTKIANASEEVEYDRAKRGFKQHEGIYFGDRFAPTVSNSYVRLLGAIACELDLDVCNFDVEQAFVQSKLDKDVFMRLPQGCGRLSGKVVRLNKSLYGLKQASRSWHAHLTTCLKTLGFQQCLVDACVFRLVEERRVAIIAVVHVDDILAVGLKSRCDVFGDELNRMVPVKNLGEIRWYGGCHYTREREMGTLTISQKMFADELVKKFCVTSTQSVPLRVGVKLEDFDEDEIIKNWPFRELVGSLMWLSVSTHPDISNAVRAVARYCTAPRAIHWKAALGILEYMNGTSEYGIAFQRGTPSSIPLEVFADADYASKATDRRSVSGGVIMCGGASVCWFSRTQKCVTLSTSEAGYVALGDAVKELLFLRQIWRFMLPSKVMPCFPVFEDNQGAVQLAENPTTNSNSKHVDVRHHFLRELVRQRDIKVVQVPSKFQHADILTKALAFDLFAFHRKFLLNLK